MIVSNTEMILRLVLAVVLGGAIGLEREMKNQAAGLRTHIAVVLGAALIMLISKYGYMDMMAISPPDTERIAAQVVSGIGFLGAGMIVVNKNRIRGLTTAASLWTTAGIGLGVGAGFYIPAITTTALLVGTLYIVQRIEQRHVKKDYKKLYAEVSQMDLFMKELDEVLTKNDVTLNRVEVLETCYPDQLDMGDNEPGIVKLYVYIHLPKYTDCSHIIAGLGVVPGVRLVEEKDK